MLTTLPFLQIEDITKKVWINLFNFQQENVWEDVNWIKYTGIEYVIKEISIKL
jgi:hypothetical protein